MTMVIIITTTTTTTNIIIIIMTLLLLIAHKILITIYTCIHTYSTWHMVHYSGPCPSGP